MKVFCTCAFNNLVDKEKIIDLIDQAKESGEDYVVVDDLCRLAAKERERVIAMSGATVAACYPRAVESLFAFAGGKVGDVINIRKVIVKHELTDRENEIEASKFDFPVPEGAWIPWYPVIDPQRCISCGKCMDYCLFGVYTIENKKVRVVNPDHCKNNCPACARVCPEKAVIFPKYGKSQINGGLVDEEPSVNIEELVKKRNLYKQLQARNQNRDSLV